MGGGGGGGGEDAERGEEGGTAAETAAVSEARFDSMEVEDDAEEDDDEDELLDVEVEVRVVPLTAEEQVKKLQVHTYKVHSQSRPVFCVASLLFVIEGWEGS